ncbi:MAG: efflux RND transporter periplasmic adaptor subunit [Candidatus Moranbacteria bacterium]|nr:efflux RND transporter periplasmic adaptor subunit [Candidatus Moranbacteria bacterium]
MKKILIPFVLILALIAFWGYKKTNSQGTAPVATEKTATPVGVQTLADGATLKKTLLFPGTVMGKDEARITAKAAGTVTSVNFDLGKSVAQGQTLVKIDDTGNNSDAGKNDFQSTQIQGLEEALRIAKESLVLAESNYKKTDSFANRSARDIAKRQYENAQIALSGALDSHLITAPISGTIVSKNVSLGDSVSAGQLLAIISRTAQLKIQFFVDQEQFANFSLGLPIKLIDNNENIFSAKITAISSQADSATKKFLIEAEPNEKNTLLGGTIIDVSLEVSEAPQKVGDILLPLASITVGQNESYLFIVDNSKAKKINVTIDNISGEIAEINLNLPESTQIIISGNKSLKDGDAVEVK